MFYWNLDIGSDETGDGSQEKPFKSEARCLDAVRERAELEQAKAQSER